MAFDRCGDESRAFLYRGGGVVDDGAVATGLVEVNGVLAMPCVAGPLEELVIAGFGAI